MNVKDMSDEYELTQSQDDIDQFNSDYNEEFNYYFIKWDKQTRNPVELYGSFNIYSDAKVYFVTDL